MKLTSAEIKTGLAIEPQNSVAAVVTGVEIDRKGYDSVVITGLTGGASGSPTVQSCVFKVQSAATSGGSYSDVSGATVTVSADSSAGEINLDLRNVARYIKVVCTITFTGGSTPAIEVASSYSLGEAKEKPAT